MPSARAIVPPVLPRAVRDPHETEAQAAIAAIAREFAVLSDPRRGLYLRPDVNLLDFCINLFGRSDLPISFLENKDLRDFLRQVCPIQEIPTGPSLRRAIIDKANKIRSAITGESEGSSYVTLLVDSAGAARRNWLASLIVTAKRVHFWRLQLILEQTTEAISRLISTVIQQLAAQHLRVIVIVSDNAANEVAALNPQDLRSIQQRLSTHVLRIPCFSHGTNLAICDWVTKSLVPNFRPCMDALIHELRKLPRKHPLHNAPWINNSRWFDLSTAVTFVSKNKPAILALSEAELTPSNRGFLMYWDFDQLAACFELVLSFLKWTEDPEAKLCEVATGT
jgi:hypothetical protein